MTSRLACWYRRPSTGTNTPSGTASTGLAQRHRRVDPEPPRLVAGRRHDAALVGPAAPDDDRPAAQLRVVALLDGREERVEVDVEDRPVGHARYHRPAVEASAGGVAGRGVVALVLALIGGVVVAWAAPVASIVLVWPILFAVPGWVIVRRVAPDLPAPGQVGVAVVVSAYLSAHVVDLVARVGGFDRPSILVASLLIAVGTVALAAAPASVAGPARPTHASPGSRATIRTDAAAWLDRRRVSAWSSRSCCSRTAGARRPTAGCPAAGTGATCSSTSRSAPASCTGTSRRGPLLRRDAADVPLVRRPPRRDRVERGGHRPDRGLLRDERGLRLGHGAPRLGPGPAPDRRPPGRCHRRHPGLPRRRDGLDAPRR